MTSLKKQKYKFIFCILRTLLKKKKMRILRVIFDFRILTHMFKIKKKKMCFTFVYSIICRRFKLNPNEYFRIYRLPVC